MKVIVERGEEAIVFFFEVEEGDRLNPSGRFTIGKPEVRVELEDIDSSKIHPDLIALCSILMCHPFVGKELKIPFSVSPKFSDSIEKVVSRYNLITPNSSAVQPRKPPEWGRMGLAYSGGVDSTAALSVIPPDSAPVFMHRSSKGNSLYNPNAALEACRRLAEVGYDVRIVKCDVEYLRDPVGFPTDLSHAIPSILLADSLSLDSLAFGTVLESAFGIGHEAYRDYFGGAHKRFFGTLMEAVGIELCLPVSGISEVGTAIIVNEGPIGDFSQSCIRGEWKKPCRKCWKCCRKGILGAALASEHLSSEEADLMFSSKEVRGKLSAVPISHENVIEYAMQRLAISPDQNILKTLKKRVQRESDLGFLERWYGPSIGLIPDKYQRNIKERILKFIKPMSKEEEIEVSQWEMTEFLEEAGTMKNSREIIDLFDGLS